MRSQPKTPPKCRNTKKHLVCTNFSKSSQHLLLASLRHLSGIQQKWFRKLVPMIFLGWVGFGEGSPLLTRVDLLESQLSCSPAMAVASDLGFQMGANTKGPRIPGFGKIIPFSKFRALGSAISRVRQDTFAEKVKVRQENITAPSGSARSALSEVLVFRKIILLNLFWGVKFRVS